jgi:hypothetical protein
MKKIIVEEVNITNSVDDIEPPPPHLKQSFKKLEDWLINICDSERPKKSVSFYAIGLFESREDRVLFLAGMSKSINSEKIVFQPQNMYFMLPPDEYKGLNQEQLDDILIIQLTDFVKTEYFLKSYLSQSDSILFRGKILIWSKPQ